MADIHRGTIAGHQVVDLSNDDNIFIDGNIDDNSRATLISRNGSITISGKIDNNCNVKLIAAGDIRIGTSGSNPDEDRKIDNNCTVDAEAGGLISLGSRINNNCDVRFDARDSVRIGGRIDDNTRVMFVSRNGSITIPRQIANRCTVTLIAARDIMIGTTGSNPDEDQKIDDNCTVKAEAGGSISLGSRINNHCDVNFDGREGVKIGAEIDDNSKVIFKSGGGISIGDQIDNNSVVELRAVDDVTIGSKIDNNCNVTIDSLRGGITIAGKIDDNTTVVLGAASDIQIGTTGGWDDRKINNRCHVYARSGGRITVGDKLGDDCVIEFRACGAIKIGSVVERGCHAFFETHEGNAINVRKIRDNNTHVTFWGGNLIEEESRHETPVVLNRRWVEAPLFCAGAEVGGEWWQNWSWKYGYVAQEKNIPETLEQLVTFIRDLDPKARTKAVGGAWSFTDASLPFDTEAAVDNVSMEKRGIGGKQPVRRLFEGAPGHVRNVAYDHQPNTVVRDREASTDWSQSRLTNIVKSGFHLPGAPQNRSIIDTRRLASSLRAGFSAIASSFVRDQVATAGRHFFHVEAGITMADLYILLDHQKPRLAIQATGGSRGATLAGTLSTATHGGEFNFPLLIDRVKAIHMVGPGGEEWWIEGSEAIADFAALSAVYPNIDAGHFIAGDWTHVECGETYTAQDVLRAVTVSMGTIGVIYSVVLEVVPAYGIQQRAKRIGNWSGILLPAADVTEAQLRGRDAAANRRLLEYILDGDRNGSGIPRAENIYVDLALNPITREAWVTNRRVTPRIPRESKELDMSMGTYEKSFSRELTNHSAGIFGLVNNEMFARVMDFLNYGRSVGDIENDIEQIGRLLTFLMSRPSLFSTLLSTVNAQMVLNEEYRGEESRKRLFMGDILTGLLNVLKGTVVQDVSDITGPSSKVGATGFTDEGLPGKALEIALPPETAFSFLQALLDRLARPGSPALIGYIAVRVVPQTQTLMGMQQFGEFSVMIEPVAVRTPESIKLIQGIMDELAGWNARHFDGGMLHWGLENDSLTREGFENSAVTRPYRAGLPSKLVVFKAIKKMLQGYHPPVFDNWFVKRLGLNDYVCEMREVTHTQKRGRNIIGLCNPGEPWSPVSEMQAVRDIRSRGIRYFVNTTGVPVSVNVMDGGESGHFLQTTSDGVASNNLISLPDC